MASGGVTLKEAHQIVSDLLVHLVSIDRAHRSYRHFQPQITFCGHRASSTHAKTKLLLSICSPTRCLMRWRRTRPRDSCVSFTSVPDAWDKNEWAGAVFEVAGHVLCMYLTTGPRQKTLFLLFDCHPRPRAAHIIADSNSNSNFVVAEIIFQKSIRCFCVCSEFNHIHCDCTCACVVACFHTSHFHSECCCVIDVFLITYI